MSAWFVPFLSLLTWFNILSLAVNEFFVSFKQPLDASSFQRLLTQVIGSAKSSNPTVRGGSIALFKSLLTFHDPNNPNNLARIAVSELFTLPKTGKSAGPDHRIALYTMAASLPAAEGVSEPLLQTATQLLAKEPSESTAAALVGSIHQHITFILRSSSLPADTMQLIAKEMTNSKPTIRKSYFGVVGAVLLNEEGVLEKESGQAFAKALLPAFETSLKNLSTNPLNSVTSPFEGYIAVACLLGPMSKSKSFGKLI